MRKRQNRPAEAAQFYEQAVALRRTSSFRDDARLARNIYNLASAYVAAGEFAKAKPLAAESLAMHEAIPEVSAELLGYHVSLQARVALGESLLPEARTLAARALDMQREAVGPSHPTIALCLDDLANVEMQLGNHDAAIALLREAESMSLPLFPTPSHPTTHAIRTRLVKALRAASKADEAVELELKIRDGR